MSESVIVFFFELCNKAAIHAKWVTVMPHDAIFVKDFMRIVDLTNPIGYAQLTQPVQQNSPSLAQTSRKTLLKSQGLKQTKGKMIVKKNVQNTSRKH